MRLKPPTSLVLLILACGALIVIWATANIAQTLPPCEPPPGQGAGAAWRQNATINVAIDPTFSPTQISTIKDQLSKWKNAGLLNITFTYPATANLGPGAVGGGNPIYFIFK